MKSGKTKLSSLARLNKAMKRNATAYAGESHNYDSNRPKRQVVSRYAK